MHFSYTKYLCEIYESRMLNGGDDDDDDAVQCSN